jgi:predicted acyl esterase
MVDLPGFGGSSGCNDWGGVREQDAVVAAVEWAARQPWSTGRVGLMGKSYDAWTGLMGIARQPKGLAAVVAMEPVYAGYRYLYTNGVRFPNSVITPADFTLFDAMPASPDASLHYQLNGAPQAWCYGVNIAMQQSDRADAAFWKQRDLLPSTKGKRTPLFLTQGFLENNTKPDAAYEFFNAMAGPKRAWFGQFAHVRGWEKIGSRYQSGRSVFVAELMRFLDRYVKGAPLPKAPVQRDAPVAVQDNLGRYRAENRWPPVDDVRLWSPLSSGTYTDDGNNTATGSGAGNGVWTFSQALPHDVWMAGEPVLDVSVETQLPRTNLVGDVYDVGPDRHAILVSRGAQLLRASGRSHATFKLYGQDWLLRKGHRIGVLLSGSNTDWWSHVPTFTSVKVISASVALPFLTAQRRVFLDGKATPRLTDYLRTATLTVDQATIDHATRTFRLPPPLHRLRTGKGSGPTPFVAAPHA